MKKNFIVAVDLGGTNLRTVLFDRRFRIKSRITAPTKSYNKKEKLIRAIAQSVNKILAVREISKSSIAGIGVGVPGPVNIQSGEVYSLTNIAGWRNVNLRKILEKELKLPVFIDNDANLMCLGEHAQGAARKYRNAICMTLGTGVGAGLIIDGRLFHGSSFAAGEIGHMPINERGPRCKCQGRACLEAYIGNSRILREARKAFGRSISLEELSRLAAERNVRAMKIWNDVGRRLGILLSGVINLLNPEAVVIGGGVANAGGILFSAVRKTVRQRAMAVAARQVRILKAHLGSDAGLIGAAVMVSRGGN